MTAIIDPLVERVAEAMWDANRSHGQSGPVGHTWEDAHPGSREFFRSLAVAAVEAMAENGSDEQPVSEEITFDGICIHCKAGIDLHGGEFWTTGYELDGSVNHICPAVGDDYSHYPRGGW